MLPMLFMVVYCWLSVPVVSDWIWFSTAGEWRRNEWSKDVCCMFVRSRSRNSCCSNVLSQTVVEPFVSCSFFCFACMLYVNKTELSNISLILPRSTPLFQWRLQTMFCLYCTVYTVGWAADWLLTGLKAVILLYGCYSGADSWFMLHGTCSA